MPLQVLLYTAILLTATAGSFRNFAEKEAYKPTNNNWTLSFLKSSNQEAS